MVDVANDLVNDIDLDEMMSKNGFIGFCLHDKRDVILRGLNMTVAKEMFEVIAERRNASCIIDESTSMME